MEEHRRLGCVEKGTKKRDLKASQNGNTSKNTKGSSKKIREKDALTTTPVDRRKKLRKYEGKHEKGVTREGKFLARKKNAAELRFKEERNGKVRVKKKSVKENTAIKYGDTNKGMIKGRIVCKKRG